MCFFIAAGTGAYMTAFGPWRVLGPQPPERLTSLVSAINVDTGEPVNASTRPTAIGPGMEFQVRLPVQGGLDGYIRLHAIDFQTDRDNWIGKRITQVDKSKWPDTMAKIAPKMTTVTAHGLRVPDDPRLMHQEVHVRVTISGIRPALEGQFLVDEGFEQAFDLTLHLGRGSIEPSGWFNFDPYNRMTTGMFTILMLLITARILRPTHTPILKDPTLPELRR